MCGVVGYVGDKPCVNLIFSGLKKLEYRGYDSSGIAAIAEESIQVVKNKGKLTQLEPLLQQLSPKSSIGMGHTRWATHGLPSTKNAHPHSAGKIAIIHNGILENYQHLKIGLLERGAHFLSETDSEVIVHLIQEELVKSRGDVQKAILPLLPKFKGAYALGVLSLTEPDTVYVIKQGSPMVVGLGKEENFFASDALALLEHTNDFLFLEDGQWARLTKNSVTVWDFQGRELPLKISHIDGSNISIEKNGFRHFMLKEIHEQPRVLANCLERLLQLDSLSFNESNLGLDALDFDKINKIHIVGCGTAYLAALTAKYTLEPTLKLPVEVELASEFRYRTPYLNEKTLVIAITQSGETADTLASVKYAKQFGCQTFAICNVRFASIPRECMTTLYMEAGPEIGVASTKAFSAMVICLYLFGLGAANKRKPLEKKTLEDIFDQLRVFPNLVEKALSQETLIHGVARKHFNSTNCIFIGRGFAYPIALEGALKLKEISYIHAEGYAGGELKHGPIALIDTEMLVVAIACRDEHYEKMLSNIEEVCAREGKVLGIGDFEDQELQRLSKDFIPCPQIPNSLLQALLSVIPLQLFSYHMAVLRETDVDQPRNLAKSVTVE